ncbi:MAG: hypothetical protein GW762_03500 [Candidatus Pacebacteria bacterium]|nr:hypothetical protein [Candidatus Paceibacterota bacterium]PIR63718.1 MAG: hypothetical protein COU64_03220 [Candidatus Pacebacteria bacterium CG10_big_fil_rev_8_21_14_0_10_40_26]PIZ79721.1 MAG: hypothetical protein COY01_00260 [Candidatus Pacebacteria bacterium CG_4_10_14_0_2_um_filter_40_20]PJA68366.1 MAG: hypothetical protein CO156_05215 [Candidatus Pacebacteria bacterium CG_4_9_14_3_um_filter_40_12]PJC41228.1 MAG: hypothetical protein CO041_05285 [Candidatus Pacebacteria bacterium CG_4_9_
MFQISKPVVQDFKEKDERAPEREITPAEYEAKNQERMAANGELINKTLQVLTSKNIVSDAEVEAFVLPNRNIPIRAIRKSITELSEQITATNMSESEQEVAQLEATRSLLVTELLYSVTGLIESTLPRKINTLVSEIRASQSVGEVVDTAKVQQLKDMQALTPQWEALVTNSTDMMKYLRDKHPQEITNMFLGSLNEALFIAVNKDAAALSVVELKSGGGMLVDEMSEVSIFLQKLLAIDVSVLTTQAVRAEENTKTQLEPKQQPQDSDGSASVEEA